MDWMTVIIQAGGAISVCGMFLWYLHRKQIADDLARSEFLKHQSEQNKSFVSHLAQKEEQLMGYLRDRDKQSQTVAKEGYGALREVASEIQNLRESMIRSDLLPSKSNKG